MLELHERLRALRKNMNLTQQQVADVLGIERTAYTYYEKGKTKPKLKTLSMLAKMYNVTLDELINGNDFIVRDGMAMVESSNSLLDKWRPQDTFASISDFEQAVLIRLRLLSNDDKRDVLKYIDKKF